MSIENARIECPAKPITHAFINFKNNDERNTHIRSANTLRKELRGRNKIPSEKTGICQILQSHETWHSSQFDFLELDVKVCVSQRPDCGKKRVKVDPSSVSSTKTLNLRLKNKLKNGNQKTHRNDCEQSRDGTKTQG